MPGTNWTKLFYCLLILVVLLHIAKRCDGRAVLSLRLGQFLNPVSRLYGNNCCNFRDGQCSPCYYEFQICVSHLSSFHYSSTGDPLCDYGRWHSGIIQPGAEPFYLPSRFPSGHSNPVQINIPDWKGRVRVTISVKDVGEWGYSNDPVIEYTLVVKEFSPARTEVNARWYYWFLVRYGVRLGLRYSVYCQRDYYGDLCQVYCRAPTFYDRYTCDPNTGQMICLPGYTGYNCQRRILPTGYPWWWRPGGRGPVPQTPFTTTVASSKSTETISSTVNVETPTNAPTSKSPTSHRNTPFSKTDTPTSITNMQTSSPSTHTSSADTHIFTISTPTSASSVPSSSSDTPTSITRTPTTTTETPISSLITPNSTLSIHDSDTHESLSRTVQDVSTTDTPSEREDKYSTPLSTTSTQDTQFFTIKTTNLTTDKPTPTTLMLSTGVHVHTPVATIIPSKTYTPTSTEGQSTPQVTTSTPDTRTSTMNASIFTSETVTLKTDTSTLKTDMSSMATSMDTLSPTFTMPTDGPSQTPSSTVETSLKSNTPINITDKLTSKMPIASTATHLHTSTAILTSEADTPISTEDSPETPSSTKEPSAKSQTPVFITDTPAFETYSPSSLTNANAPTTVTLPSKTDTPVVGTSIRTDTTVYTPNPTTKSISQFDKMTTIARLIDQTVLPKSETATMKVQPSTNSIAIITASSTKMQPTKLSPTESVFEPSTLITEYATTELHSQDANVEDNVTTEQTTPLANSTLQHTQYSSETPSLKISTTVDDRYITTGIVTSETLELSPSREYSETTIKSSPYPSSPSAEGVTTGPHPTTDRYSVVTDIEYILTHVPEIAPTKDTTVEESTTDFRSGATSFATPRSKTKLTKKPTDHRRLKNNTSSRIPTTTMISPTSVDSVKNAVAGNASVSSTSSSKPTVGYTNITDIAIHTTTIDSPDMAMVDPTFASVTNQDSSKYPFYSTSTISTNDMVSTERFSKNSTESIVRTSVTSPNVTLTVPLSSSLTSSSTSFSDDPTVGTSIAVRQPSVLLRNRTFFPIRTMSSRICWTNKPNDVETSCKCGRGDLPKLPSIEDYSWTIAFSNGKIDNLPVKIGIS
ncbi:mucin-2-like isoform X1 [Lytechinus variegatus]|uniref:mucin-2-like isoform X1 n=1 Tax=Lytechinus variegatus TaxID=7654 RepID=UPI001BB17783|nr:mucin-2-like isoform X1 [Lytechinus variegatus]